MKRMWVIITVIIMAVSIGNVNGKCYHFNGLEYGSLEEMEDAVLHWREDKGNYDEEGNLVSLHKIWETVDGDGDPVYFTSERSWIVYLLDQRHAAGEKTYWFNGLEYPTLDIINSKVNVYKSTKGSVYSTTDIDGDTVYFTSENGRRQYLLDQRHATGEKTYWFNGLEYPTLDYMEDAVLQWREDKGDYDEDGNLVSIHEIWEAVDEDGDPVYFTSKSALNRYAVGCCI